MRRSTRCGTRSPCRRWCCAPAGDPAGSGFILPTAEAQRFAAAVPPAPVPEIDANHYTITTHDHSIASIGAFLRTS
jgi:hypothetical protein